MSVIKTVVRALANRFLPKDELLTEALAARSKEDVAGEATLYIRRSAPLLDRTGQEYKKAVTAAEELLLSHHNASSLAQLCRSHVRKNSKPEYYFIAVIGQLIDQHNTANGIGSVVPGGEAGELIAKITGALTQAKEQTNFIKRRSIIREAVKAELPGITADRAAAITELLLLQL
jgi:hypothetical protein